MKKMKNNTKTENTKKIEINKKEMKTKLDKNRKKKNNCVSCQLGASYYTTH
jgi:hypothetical protein